MARKGKYTRRPGVARQSHGFLTRKWRWFKRLSLKQKFLLIGLPILAFLIFVPLITYALLARDISDPERLMNRNNTGVELLDREGKVFYSTAIGNSSERLSLDEIADVTEEAIISSEDKDFYKHSGVSIRGILGALYANIAQRDATAYGGSTLTQQLVKNTLLTSDKTFFRKYQEVVMAIAVDRQYTKDEILDMYLNSVYFGENAFGIEQAARTYFDKAPADLNLAQSAMLVGLLPAPSAYSPVSGDPELAKERQESVLRRMVEDGKITEEEKAEAIAQKLAYANGTSQDATLAPHFAQMVIAELNEEYGEERVTRSGYKVTTTLDRSWQKEAESIVATQSEVNALSNGDNAALVAIDPKNGEIKALVGSADYDNEEFGKVNMAVSPRQPGSSFKPIYTAEAINQEVVTAATILRDEPTNFGGYKPENFDFQHRGNISVRNAISQSLNIPLVKIMEKLGVDESVAVAQRMGIDTITDDQDYGLSLALGSGEVQLVDMVNAYAAFANQGQQYDQTKIQKIESKYGDVIFSQQRKSKEVQSAEASYIMSQILSDNAARAPTFGAALDIPGHTVAVKTGSTDDNRDAWTIGYTPSVAIGVWVGNNENEVMSAGGSSLAGPIWRNAMTTFLSNKTNEGFPQPDGIEEVAVCRGTEKRAVGGGQGVYTEYFVKGTVPTETCNAPQEREETPEQDDDNEREERRDNDGDGVLNRDDNCPNTPRGVEVDENGCEIEDRPVDSDGDGVNDDDDDCPNTSRGVEVDENGCEIEAEDPRPDPGNPGGPPSSGGGSPSQPGAGGN